MGPLDQLENEVAQSVRARVTIADKWTGTVIGCVAMVCVTAVTIAVILHG